ncbi:MAG TPA: putative Ig domain-containing protein [Gammaproteobacteria bacterium]|jgi:hypothetical protein|nr:putative Ig domain-containing protein [Gammaproteobacteria bacterium]
MQAPKIIKQIPNQGVNERAAFGPFDLKEYIKTPDDSEISFSAEISGGEALPRGMICTADGLVTGIPAKDTQGNYEVVITAANEAGSVQATFQLSIMPNLSNKSSIEFLDDLKTQVWKALEHGMTAPPELDELLDRAITPLDIYYLLERWGTLTIYDAFNLEPPGEKKLIVLEGASEEFVTYDRGSCLVAAPKNLFSFERTLADGIASCEALAREAFKRNWTVELVGFEKYTRAAWVEIQNLSAKNNRKMEVLNYDPTPGDENLVRARADASTLQQKGV